MKSNTAKLAFGDNVLTLRGATGLTGIMPGKAALYPELRYMGSKKRLLPWIHSVLDTLDFESAADVFSGTGSVGYLMKAMGRRVLASDFLNFTSTIARATIENSTTRLDGKAIKQLISLTPSAHQFIEKNFEGVFFTKEDLQFLDRVSGNIQQLTTPHQQALAYSALSDHASSVNLEGCLRSLATYLDMTMADGI